MALGWVRRATRSGRGGTTGRTVGWPAKLVLVCGLAEGSGAAGGGCKGLGTGWLPPKGANAALGISTTIDGKGCRGPERIWPGLGDVGTGLAGTPAGRAGGGAVAGSPVSAAGRIPARGGRSLCGAARPASKPSFWGTASEMIAAPSASDANTPGADETGVASGVPSGAAASCPPSPACGRAAGAASPMPLISAAAVGSSGSRPKWRRNRSATSSSTELEWVFFSVMPNWGSISTSRFGFTSSSRANSLIRILPI